MSFLSSVSLLPSLDEMIASISQEVATFRAECALVDAVQLTNEQLITLGAEDRAIQAQLDLIARYLATHAVAQVA